MTALTRHSVALITHACIQTSAYTEKRAKKTTVTIISNVTQDAVMITCVHTSSIATRAVRKILIATQLQHRTAAVKASALMTSSAKEIKSMATTVTPIQSVLLDTVIRKEMFAQCMKRCGHHGMF